METKRTRNTMKRLLIPIIILLLAAPAHAQQILNAYVEEGLQNNIVLQQKNILLEQAKQSLQIARSYFLPSITLLGDYTSGDGGRSIALPIGDLLNPVYTSLNQMTQSDAFPQVENVNQNFFPKNFYDARVRTSVPLVNTDLYMNRSIRSQQVMLQQYETEAYKRELVLDIKTAYYNYLAATAATKIYESAQQLVNKNVEINESLLKNGKSLPATLMRSKSEAEKVKADLASAKNTMANARRYFNFLLNKDLDADVTWDETITTITPVLTDTSGVVREREELLMLKTAREINQSTMRMYKLNRAPKLSAFLDLGSQGEDWQVNSNSRYYLFGVQLSLPLFQGFRNNMSIRQTNLDVQKTELQLGLTTKQLELANAMARNDLQTAHQNYLASQEQLKSAQGYFNLIDKGYREGVNSLIEFLDARNQLTTSQLEQSLRHFDVLKAEARLERENASYSIDN